MISIKLDLVGLPLVPSGKLRLSRMGSNEYFNAFLKSMTWILFVVRHKRSPKTSLLTSAMVRLFFFMIYFFFTIDLLMLLGMGPRNVLEDNKSRSWINSFAIIMPSCCRFSSLVGVSISHPDLRFISMVLSSAIPNGFTYLFSKTATTIDLRGSDFMICEGRLP